MSGYEGYEVRIGVAASTATGDGWYAIQVPGLGPRASASHYEWQPTFGFAARPLPANDDGACLTFYLPDGDLAWCGHDNRFSRQCPPLTEGSSAQWNSKGAFALLDATTDTFTVYVPRNDGSAASTFVIGQDANESPYTELRHQNGAYIAQTVDSTVIRHTGNALIEVLENAITLNGAVNTTASMTVGGAGAQSLVNATGLTAALTAASATLKAAGAAPMTGAAIAAVFDTLILAMSTPAVSTQMIKGV